MSIRMLVEAISHYGCEAYLLTISEDGLDGPRTSRWGSSQSTGQRLVRTRRRFMIRQLGTKPLPTGGEVIYPLPFRMFG